jgi:hypothetical protein
MNLGALGAAFCDEPARARLRASFADWASGVPEVETGR